MHCLSITLGQQAEWNAIDDVLNEEYGDVCKKKIDNRVDNIKNKLKNGKWHIDENENKIVHTAENNENVITDITTNGIKELLITKDENVGNEICTKNSKEIRKRK